MENNNDRRITKDLEHMESHLEIATTHINFVKAFLRGAKERERATKRRDDG